MRGGGSGGDAAGDAGWRSAAYGEYRCPGSGVRSRLCSRRGAARLIRVRRGELYRIRKQEFGAGAQDGIVIAVAQLPAVPLFKESQWLCRPVTDAGRFTTRSLALAVRSKRGPASRPCYFSSLAGAEGSGV